jgi:signal transduction histidine kinase
MLDSVPAHPSQEIALSPPALVAQGLPLAAFAMSAPTPPRAYRLRGRLLLVISVLVTLVLVSVVVTASTAFISRNGILKAHSMEVMSRRAALLSVTAREQYIHEAHTIILRDHSHVDHHDEWVDKLNTELTALRPDVSPEEAARLDAVRAASRDLKRLFSSSILPAIDRQDYDEVRRSHDRANALVDQMTEHADALASYFERQATLAENEADRLIRMALGISIVLGLLATAIALLAGQSLWRSFSRPLASLERVAQQVATGDRQARVEPLAAVELKVVAEAFNRMLDAVARAEADLVATERLAAIGRLAAGVAHEINNPIAVIRGYVKTMRQEAESAALREELQILDEEAAACQRIAEDLLVYARSPAMAPVPVQAAELLKDAAERLESTPPREGSSSTPIVVDAEPSVISVDPLRIRQVLVNLMTNAREATADDEPIVVRGSRRGDGYQIEVLDRGPGFSDEIRERLFEPFFTTRRDGTGLGLAVCYGLVTAHGGTIRAEPRPEGGSRFVVDLPGVVADEERSLEESA